MTMSQAWKEEGPYDKELITGDGSISMVSVPLPKKQSHSSLFTSHSLQQSGNPQHIYNHTHSVPPYRPSKRRPHSTYPLTSPTNDALPHTPSPYPPPRPLPPHLRLSRLEQTAIHQQHHHLPRRYQPRPPASRNRHRSHHPSPCYHYRETSFREAAVYKYYDDGRCGYRSGFDAAGDGYRGGFGGEGDGDGCALSVCLSTGVCEPEEGVSPKAKAPDTLPTTMQASNTWGREVDYSLSFFHEVQLCRVRNHFKHSSFSE